MSPPFLKVSVTIFQNKAPKMCGPNLLFCIYSISSLNAGKGEISPFLKTEVHSHDVRGVCHGLL